MAADIETIVVGAGVVGLAIARALTSKGQEVMVVEQHELIGSEVVDQHGTERGTVTSVELNPASDLLVLEGGGLVPLTFVVDHTDGRITVDVPDGLFD